ncbi:MAG: transcriptional regulator [Nocardioides sp.]|nr:transcriptional regulator [Nocardioides sp.]
MEADDRRLRTAAARADFLESGEPGAAGVTDLVRASWRRSRSAGVDADDYLVAFHADVDYDSRLVRCARPVIERLSDDMPDVPVTIALADTHARIVERVDCSTSVGRVLDRVDFLKGFAFVEGGVGTNGIGTVFEAGSSVAVVGAEHFSEKLVKFACTGAPILDPITGRVEGVLDISSLAESWSPIMHTLVKSAADDIARNLLLDRNQAHQALFEMYLKACNRPRQAVIAVGGNSLMVNERAQARFGPQEQFLLQQHGRMLMARRDRSVDTVTLPDGRPVHLRVSRIVSGDQVAGLVMLLTEETTAEDRASQLMPVEHALPSLSRPDRRTSMIADGLRRAPVTVTDGSCPAWRKCCSETFAALGSREHLLVIGETGTGKFTLLAELFQRAHTGGRCVSLDARDITDDTRFQLRERDRGTGPTLFLLRHLDQLTTAGAELLEEELEARAGCPDLFVAATVQEGTLGTGLPFQLLLRHFDRSVTLPPIRFRVDDLAALVARTLREMAPDRRVRLSPEACRLITRYSWPRNMAQLREALTSALGKRPVGEIQAQDLPGYCHTAGTRTLTTLETTERDTLVRALRDLGGNRVQAAAHLGMSRSSLYRKLKRYGITEV